MEIIEEYLSDIRRSRNRFFIYYVLTFSIALVIYYCERKGNFHYQNLNGFLRFLCESFILLGIASGIGMVISLIFPKIQTIILRIFAILANVVIFVYHYQKERVLHIVLEILLMILIVLVYYWIYDVVQNCNEFISYYKILKEHYMQYLYFIDECNDSIERKNNLNIVLREMDDKYGEEKNFGDKLQRIIRGKGFKDEKHIEDKIISKIPRVESGILIWNSPQSLDLENERIKFNSCLRKILKITEKEEKNFENRNTMLNEIENSLQELLRNESRVNNEELPEKLRDIFRNTGKEMYNSTLKTQKYKKY